GVIQMYDHGEGPEHTLRHIRLLSEAGEVAFLHEQDQGLQRGANGDLYRNVGRSHNTDLFDLVSDPVHVVLYGLGETVGKILHPFAKKRDDGVHVCGVRLKSALDQWVDMPTTHFVSELIVAYASAPLPQWLKEAVLDSVPTCDDR